MSGYIGVQPVPQATQRREYFTATSGQTTFNTNGYTPNYIDVYMNGVKLSPADFTASNGSDVVLASGATTGDLVQVVSFTPFNVANQTFIGDVNLSSGAYKIGGNTAINSSRGGSLTSLALTGNATFGDNDKAIFGAGSDLQIYHDGSASYIKDAGTGNFELSSNGDGFYFRDGSSNYLLTLSNGGPAKLWHNGSEKLATTSTGIDVTGTVTADGLTVDLGSTSDVTVNGTDGGGIQFNYGGVNQVRIDSASNDGGVYHTPTGKNHTFKTDGANRLKIATGGDISFYEDTGTTAKFFWDASAESLGIGTSSPADPLDVRGTGTAYGSGYIVSRHMDAAAGKGVFLGYDADETAGVIGGANFLTFQTYNGSWSERMRITSSGSVGIGTSSPSTRLTVGAGAGTEEIRVDAGAGWADLTLNSNSTNGGHIYFNDGSNAGEIFYYHASDYMAFNTAGAEAMRIDASGRVGIGITPAAVADNTGADSLQLGGTFLIHYDEDGPGTTTLGNNIYYNGTANKALFTGATSQYYQAGGTHVWRNSGSTSAGSTTTMSESMRIDSSGHAIIPAGVTLGTSAGVYNAANTLDDYEEGTWTPYFGGSGGNPTVTYSSQRGTYVKTGNMVIAHFKMNWTAWTVDGSGYTTILGLPFTSKSGSGWYTGSISETGNGLVWGSGYTQVSVEVVNGGTTMAVTKMGSQVDQAVFSPTVAVWSSNDYLNGVIMYPV